jgi:hypothetical protein
MKKFKILSFYPGLDAISEKTISRYCPFKNPGLLNQVQSDKKCLFGKGKSLSHLGIRIHQGVCADYLKIPKFDDTTKLRPLLKIFLLKCSERITLTGKAIFSLHVII